MKALLSAGFYRLVRQKSTWIILGVFAVWIGFSAFSLGSLLGDAPWAAALREQMIASLNSARSAYNADVVDAYLELLGTVSVKSRDYFISLGHSADSMLFLYAFLLCFVDARRKHGALKHVWPSASPAARFRADLLLCGFFIVLMEAVQFLAFSIMGLVSFTGVPYEHPLFLLPHYAVEAMLLLCVAALMTAALDLLAKSRLRTWIPLFYLLFIRFYLFLAVDGLFANTVGEGTRLEDFLPSGAYETLPYGSVPDLLRGAVVAILFTGAAFLAEIHLFPKRDAI
ncbi:MAG: hypothetical protein J6U26_05305 [Lachnospiraceae bacterium]|nr:hypothetical protein [Lachnospiraceae bacterium]